VSDPPGPTPSDHLASKFNPYHDELGRFTTADGATDSLVHRVNRRGSIVIRVDGRMLEATPGQAARFAAVEPGAQAAIRRVQQLDPGWRPRPSLIETIEGAIARAESNAREAEARLAEVLPRGFGTYENYVAFGQSLRDGLRAAGFRDVEPMIRGSAVTGESFRTGQPFDVGRRSDYDLALVSPTLMQRAIDLGIPLRGGGTRTVPLGNNALARLELRELVENLRNQADRPVSFMIYGSRQAVTRRGPSRPIVSSRR
jgi:hypothetical protein